MYKAESAAALQRSLFVYLGFSALPRAFALFSAEQLEQPAKDTRRFPAIHTNSHARHSPAHRMRKYMRERGAILPY